MTRKKPRIIENKIYASLIGECEKMETTGNYIGNGHHLAQRLTSMVSVGLLAKKQKQIYDVMTKDPTSVKKISKLCRMSSNLVSAQLHQMNDSTLLVLFKKDKKNKLWYRAN